MTKQDRNRRYYLANKQKCVDLNQAVRDRNYAYVNEIKDQAVCLDCKVSYPYYIMDFDHVRGEKFRNVSDMCRQMFSLVKIQEEIDKCELVCSNCHRARTHLRKINGEAPMVRIIEDGRKNRSS